MTLITSADGIQYPPHGVVDRLKQIDPRLGLKFVDLSWRSKDQRWGITLEWEERDPRRELIFRGQVNPGDSHDILGYLPGDCPPEQAYGYVVSALRRHRTREDVNFMLNKCGDYNERVEKEIVQPILDYAEEEFDKFRHRHFVTDRR